MSSTSTPSIPTRAALRYCTADGFECYLDGSRCCTHDCQVPDVGLIVMPVLGGALALLHPTLPFGVSAVAAAVSGLVRGESNTGFRGALEPPGPLPMHLHTVHNYGVLGAPASARIARTSRPGLSGPLPPRPHPRPRGPRRPFGTEDALPLEVRHG
jgi:hypothetical protein